MGHPVVVLFNTSILPQEMNMLLLFDWKCSIDQWGIGKTRESSVLESESASICHLYPLVKSHVLHPQTGNTKEPLEGEPPTPDPENLIDLSDNSLDKDLGQGRRPKRAAARLAEIRMEEMKPYL